MLGELIGESTGRRIVRRVLSVEPPAVEVSFEDGGHMLGIPVNGFGTYTAVLRPDGTAIGNGQGAMASAEGEGITWTGSGLGKLGLGGAISYRGILYYRTTSEKFSHLNTVAGVFEYEVDAAGNTHSKVWEWK
jgi:hypothetical protein